MADLGSLPNNGAFSDRSTSRALGVDAAGRVHFMSSVDGQLFYGTCASGCVQPTSWTFASVDPASALMAAAVAPDGSLHVGYETDKIVYYRTCAAGCATANHWSTPLGLYYMYNTALDIAVDAQGHPRLVFNQGHTGIAEAASNEQMTFYAWCDAGCTATDGWQSMSVGFKAGDGMAGVSVALDSAGSPVVTANLVSAYGLGMAACTAACATTSATWNNFVVETDDQVTGQLAPPLPACPIPNAGATPLPAAAYWFPGEESFLALSPIARRFAVAHRTYTLESCGQTLKGEGVSIVRYSGGQLP